MTEGGGPIGGPVVTRQRRSAGSVLLSTARRALTRPVAEAATVVIGLVASVSLAERGYTIAGVVLGSAAIAYPVTVTVFGRTGSSETALVRRNWSGRLRGLSWITYLIAFVVPAAWYKSDIGWFGEVIVPRMHIGSAAFVDGLTPDSLGVELGLARERGLLARVVCSTPHEHDRCRRHGAWRPCGHDPRDVGARAAGVER